MAEAKKNYSNIEKINSLLGAEGIGSLLKDVQGTEKKVGIFFGNYPIWKTRQRRVRRKRVRPQSLLLPKRLQSLRKRLPKR